MAESIEPPRKPTADELLAAVNRTIRDVIAPGLNVLFVGINPGLYSAATGHHFARPGNRFWPALYASGFTPRLLKPWEEQQLPALGVGITNINPRATASAAELSRVEFPAGAKALQRKVLRYQPKVMAVLGVGAYRLAFHEKTAALGRQERTIGSTQVWVLPNPSGLNAHYQPKDLAKLFRQMRESLNPNNPTSKPTPG
jgi:TDG/mug DNA glycosylase family protein